MDELRRLATQVIKLRDDLDRVSHGLREVSEELNRLTVEQPDPFEVALRAKVMELFGDAAQIHRGTHNGELMFAIGTTLEVEHGDLLLDEVRAWMRYQGAPNPLQPTVVGLLRMERQTPWAAGLDPTQSTICGEQ